MMKSIKEFFAHNNNHCRFVWWGRFVGFNAMWYERYTCDNPPVVCGFQIDAGWATLHVG